MCRRILNLKDELYFHHIRDRKILDQIVECFKENGDRYNLLNSAIIEFFEFIRSVSLFYCSLFIQVFTVHKTFLEIEIFQISAFQKNLLGKFNFQKFYINV